MQVSSEQSLALQAAEKERQTKLTKSFNKRFNIKDEDGAVLRFVAALYCPHVIELPSLRAQLVCAALNTHQALFMAAWMVAAHKFQ